MSTLLPSGRLLRPFTRCRNFSFRIKSPPVRSGPSSPDVPLLSWQAVPGAMRYEIFRGQISGLMPLDYGQCLAETSETVLDDPETPAVGAGLFYLVNAVGENIDLGGLGQATCYERPRIENCSP